MCLIVIAHRVRADVPCVIVANRDERYARATAPLQRWQGADAIYAGRDLEQGGTWLGATETGRFAALTNFRAGAVQTGAESRGHVVSEFLRAGVTPGVHMGELAQRGQRFGGFSLLTGELGGELYYGSNRGGEPRRLEPGIYGLSNQWLDTPWPKVLLAKQRVTALLTAEQLTPEALSEALLDRTIPPDAELPDTGVGLEAERRLAPCFIAGEHYGTRAVTAVLLRSDGESVMYERAYGPGGVYLSDARASFSVERPRY